MTLVPALNRAGPFRMNTPLSQSGTVPLTVSWIGLVSCITDANNPPGRVRLSRVVALSALLAIRSYRRCPDPLLPDNGFSGIAGKPGNELPVFRNWEQGNATGSTRYRWQVELG